MDLPAIWAFVSLHLAGIALAVALYNAIVSRSRLKVAIQNNVVAASAPWGQLLTNKVGEELAAVLRDHDLVTRLYEVPFQTIAEKKECRARLTELREQSRKALVFLMALAPDAQALSDAREELEKIEDSFLFNEELRMSNNTHVLKLYRAAHAEYLLALRAFAMVVNVDRVHLKPTGFWARLKKKFA